MSDSSYTYPSPPAVPDAAPQFQHDVRRSATFWGLMLIVLGTAFLAAQFVPTVSWWMLWPLVVIVSGVAHAVSTGRDDTRTMSRVFEGLGTVLVGAVLLGNTTGYVAWTVWLTFISLWPVLLIALGISIIGRGLGMPWLRIASRLLVWSTLAAAVYVSLTGVSMGLINREPRVLSIPGVGANGTTVNISIEPEPDHGIPAIRTW
jgi:hypothetical protein